MNDKIKELLDVLDMSGEEQKHKILDALYKSGREDLVTRISWDTKTGETLAYGLRGDISLADLAFRLRDETKSLKHYLQFQGRLKTYNYTRRNVSNRCDINHIDEYWWAMEAQPIHWIIAALIAKELACEQS